MLENADQNNSKYGHFLRSAGKFYIKKKKSKVASIETGYIVIAHLLSCSDLEKCMYTTLF